jgi:uncharacterized protein (TIGR02453 family)
MQLQNVLQFLRELKENNNREWFNTNKDRYLSAKADFDGIVELLIKGISKFDPSVASLTTKECVFRIYRDVRFSKNKEPYKVNFGAAFNKGGKKNPVATYYIHIEPGNSFIGGGMWMPPADVLKKVRSEIYYNAAEFKKVITNRSFKETFGDLMEEKLKRPPKGYSSDFADIELIKYKSYVVGENVSDEDVVNKGFIEDVLNTFKVMYPFNQYLDRALD